MVKFWQVLWINPVDKWVESVDNFGMDKMNFVLHLLITADFLWITLLELFVKLVQTCGEIG